MTYLPRLAFIVLLAGAAAGCVRNDPNMNFPDRANHSCVIADSFCSHGRH